VPGVAIAAPMFMTALYDTNGTRAVYVGVDTNSLALKTAWHITGRFPSLAGELLVGAEAAREHYWSLGARVALPAVANGEGLVSGLLARTGSGEDEFIYLPLADAQQRFHHSDELTHILIRLADPNDLERVVAQLRGCEAGLAMNVVPVAHVFQTIQALVNVTRVLLGCIAAIALLVAGTGVANTILMAVTERLGELAVMRAVGASRAQVFGLVWVETAQVCFFGGIAGVLCASAASSQVEKWIRAQLPFAPAQPLIHWHWNVALGCLAAALLLGCAAGILPALRAVAVKPMILMRSTAL